MGYDVKYHMSLEGDLVEETVSESGTVFKLVRYMGDLENLLVLEESVCKDSLCQVWFEIPKHLIPELYLPFKPEWLQEHAILSLPTGDLYTVNSHMGFPIYLGDDGLTPPSGFFDPSETEFSLKLSCGFRLLNKDRALRCGQDDPTWSGIDPKFIPCTSVKSKTLNILRPCLSPDISKGFIRHKGTGEVRSINSSDTGKAIITHSVGKETTECSWVNKCEMFLWEQLGPLGQVGRKLKLATHLGVKPGTKAIRPEVPSLSEDLMFDGNLEVESQNLSSLSVKFKGKDGVYCLSWLCADDKPDWCNLRYQIGDTFYKDLGFSITETLKVVAYTDNPLSPYVVRFVKHKGTQRVNTDLLHVSQESLDSVTMLPKFYTGSLVRYKGDLYGINYISLRYLTASLGVKVASDVVEAKLNELQLIKNPRIIYPSKCEEEDDGTYT